MVEEVVQDYAAYFKLDLTSGFQTVQDVIDNMLTRLEELTSVLHMIKMKNSECASALTEDISKYRSDITILSKKINTVSDIILQLTSNVDLIEKQVQKAESDFNVHSDNKIKSFLKPFLMRSKESVSAAPQAITPPQKVELPSVIDNFEQIKM
ncbi:uncharacterized protein LOC125226397 [Leguminivora glycinivorella]|uniref:uncharacterized protein LOC125226397 n=1 Tax=Leguminivora glycinivorella TaxID=1035111 RepID=UPI00200D42A4|nr:uncharacterized protein LOC125226397 [Leguminivora glycinivorella]